MDSPEQRNCQFGGDQRFVPYAATDDDMSSKFQNERQEDGGLIVSETSEGKNDNPSPAMGMENGKVQEDSQQQKCQFGDDEGFVSYASDDVSAQLQKERVTGTEVSATSEGKNDVSPATNTENGKVQEEPEQQNCQLGSVLRFVSYAATDISAELQNEELTDGGAKASATSEGKNDDVSPALTMENSYGEEEYEPTKRSRGRPKKQPLLEITGPRGKGRPKKGTTYVKPAQKDHQCQFCPEVFAKYSCCFAHMVKEHQAKPMRCRYCPESFSNSSQLREHWAEVHKPLNTHKMKKDPKRGKPGKPVMDSTKAAKERPKQPTTAEESPKEGLLAPLSTRYVQNPRRLPLTTDQPEQYNVQSVAPRSDNLVPNQTSPVIMRQYGGVGLCSKSQERLPSEDVNSPMSEYEPTKQAVKVENVTASIDPSLFVESPADEAVKRGRGRPRILDPLVNRGHPRNSPQTGQTETEPIIKRGRGRPRKQSIETTPSIITNAAELAESAPPYANIVGATSENQPTHPEESDTMRKGEETAHTLIQQGGPAFGEEHSEDMKFIRSYNQHISSQDQMVMTDRMEGDALRTSPAEEAGVEAMEDSTDTLTRSVLVQMAALGHDKAKELTSSPPSSDRETAQVLSWLASLCQAEKLYFSLHFLNSRTSIFRKENALKGSYHSLLTEMTKISDAAATQQLTSPSIAGTPTFPSFATTSRRTSSTMSASTSVSLNNLSLVHDLKVFTSMRMEMIELYELIANRGCECEEATAPSTKLKANPQQEDGGLGAMLEASMFPYATVKKVTHRIRENYYQRMMNSGSLGKLAEAFKWEFDILEGLVSCLHLLNSWKYWESLIELTRAKDGLARWEECQKLRQEPCRSAGGHQKGFFDALFGSRSTAASAAASGDDRTANDPPALYRWLSGLKDTVLSKFTLYFYEVLEKQTTRSEMRQTCDRKLNINYMKQIENFQSENGLPIVSVVYEATHDDDFVGVNGYHYPDKISKPIVDPNALVPAVFTSWMTVDADGETDFQIGSRPGLANLHWKPVLKALEDDRWNLALPNTVINFYDQQVKYTYYMTRIDPLMTLLTIYETKVRGKCPKLTKFMLDLARNLRGCKHFAALKAQIQAR